MMMTIILVRTMMRMTVMMPFLFRNDSDQQGGEGEDNGDNHREDRRTVTTTKITDVQIYTNK